MNDNDDDADDEHESHACCDASVSHNKRAASEDIELDDEYGPLKRHRADSAELSSCDSDTESEETEANEVSPLFHCYGNGPRTLDWDRVVA